MKISDILLIGEKIMSSVVVREDTLNEINVLLNILDKYAIEYRFIKPISSLCVIVYRMTYSNHIKMIEQLRIHELELIIEEGTTSYVTLKKI